MSASDYAENEYLDAAFIDGNVFGTPIWVTLSTANPTDDCSGLSEPIGNGFGRVQKDAGATHWNAASGASLTNKTDIDFGAASGGSWGTLTHFALFDRDIESEAITGVTTGGAGAADFDIADPVVAPVVGEKIRVRGSTGNDGIRDPRQAASTSTPSTAAARCSAASTTTPATSRPSAPRSRPRRTTRRTPRRRAPRR